MFYTIRLSVFYFKWVWILVKNIRNDETIVFEIVLDSDRKVMSVLVCVKGNGGWLQR